MFATASLSDRSKQHYTRMINLWTAKLDKPLDHILSHATESINTLFLKIPELQTQKAYISAMMALFKYQPELKRAHQKSHGKWVEYAIKINDQVAERYANGAATQRQEQAYIPWQEVLRKLDELSTTEYASKRHLLLAMYVLEEPKRQDYGNVQFIMDSSPLSTPTIPPTQNCIRLTKDGRGTLVLANYKTQKKYGTLEFLLKPELMRIILTNLRAHPRKYLFESQKNTPYSDDAFIKFTSRTLHSLFAPKPVTVTTLRHSLIKYMYEKGMTHKEREELSKRMCHGIAMQSAYSFEFTDHDTKCKVVCGKPH